MDAPWRLLRHPPAAGDWNMAADELLLQQADGGHAPPCLRLYAWDRPTLSLGYFQSLDEIPPEARQRYAVVRRTTGGGAILHHREVTYSVAVRRDCLDGTELYDRANRALLLALSGLGAAVEIRGPQREDRAQRGPFFCFARAGATDIIAPSCDQAKLAGSAQRRWHQAVLQHGSVLLESDEPGAVGLAALLRRPVEFDELAEQIIHGFQREFACRFCRDDFSAAEFEQVECIRRRRYGNPSWLARGNRKGLDELRSSP